MKDARYREELDVCKQDHVDHVDIPFSARHLPSPETLNNLLAEFDHGRYPLLIHCQAGSDRTGLASTLYVHLMKKTPLDEAERSQLTWHYGHLPVGPTKAMDDFFTLYRNTSRGEDMRTWIKKDYPALYAESPEK